MSLRGSTARWRQLSTLLLNLERAIESCARLDAHARTSASIGKHHEHLIAFNARVTTLETRVDQELDRLTVERLDVDLQEKQMTSARCA